MTLLQDAGGAAAAQRLRWHSLEITDKAGSGHPTSALPCADIMSVLFFEVLHLGKGNPRNKHNDRFILSKGHAAPVLWSGFYEAGLIDKEGLHSLREVDSQQEGHPTPRNPWVDVATGSLGQGLSMGSGMAWSARKENTDSRTFVLLGDGEMAEGAVWEAASLAGLCGLADLTAIVDINQFGQREATPLGDNASTYRKRFEAFGWHTVEVDGHDFEALAEAFGAARVEKSRPAAILALTTKGKGVASLEGATRNTFRPRRSSRRRRERCATWTLACFRLEMG